MSGDSLRAASPERFIDLGGLVVIRNGPGTGILVQGAVDIAHRENRARRDAAHSVSKLHFSNNEYPEAGTQCLCMSKRADLEGFSNNVGNR